MSKATRASATVGAMERRRRRPYVAVGTAIEGRKTGEGGGGGVRGARWKSERREKRDMLGGSWMGEREGSKLTWCDGGAGRLKERKTMPILRYLPTYLFRVGGELGQRRWLAGRSGEGRETLIYTPSPSVPRTLRRGADEWAMPEA